jgi:ketosteroid isomerase-like protein
MTSRADIETLLQMLYEARVQGDLDGVCRLFSGNVRFEMIGTGNRTPLGINANGAVELRTLMALLIRTFRISNQVMLSVIIDGLKVAVLWRASVHSRITGQTVTTEFIDIVEIHGDRISSYLEYFVPR